MDDQDQALGVVRFRPVAGEGFAVDLVGHVGRHRGRGDEHRGHQQ